MHLSEPIKTGLKRRLSWYKGKKIALRRNMKLMKKLKGYLKRANSYVVR